MIKIKLKDVLKKFWRWIDIWEETLWVMRHPKMYHDLRAIASGSLRNEKFFELKNGKLIEVKNNEF